MVAKAIHSMIRVLDEARSVDFYDRAFGLKVADRLDFPNFTLIYLRNPENDFELELTVNKDQSEAYDLGNGYGHMAFAVDDLDAEHARFTEAGFEPRKLVAFAPGGEGTPVIARFFFVADPTATRSRFSSARGATSRAAPAAGRADRHADHDKPDAPGQPGQQQKGRK